MFDLKDKFGELKKDDQIKNINSKNENYYNQIQDITNKIKNMDIRINSKVTERVLFYIQTLEKMNENEYINSKDLEHSSKIKSSIIIKDLLMLQIKRTENFGYHVKILKLKLKHLVFDLDSKGEVIELFPELKLSIHEVKLLKDLMKFNSFCWNRLLNWARTNKKLEKNCYNILSPLINGRPLESLRGIDTIELIDLYSYLLDEGFEKIPVKKYKKSIKVKTKTKTKTKTKGVPLKIKKEPCLIPLEKNITLVKPSNKDIEDYKKITDLILNKLKRLEDIRFFTKEEWKNILDFGIQYDLFNFEERLKAEKIERLKKNDVIWNRRLLTIGERTYKIVERNGYNVSIFDLYEWNEILNHLKDSEIITPNIIYEFYALSDESEETGFFSLEQLKFISPYLDIFKKVVRMNKEKELKNFI